MSQLSSDLRSLNSFLFIRSLISQLGRQTLSQGTSTFENLVCRARVCRTRAQMYPYQSIVIVLHTLSCLLTHGLQC